MPSEDETFAHAVNEPERLRDEIHREERRLRGTIPANERAALLAILREQDRRQSVQGSSGEEQPDLIAGSHFPNLGGKKAVQICLAGGDSGPGPVDDPGGDELARWAESYLHACGDLAAAEMVLGHGETGFMRLVATASGTFHSWIATRSMPTVWQERQDVDWWAAALARQFLASAEEKPHRTARAYLAAMGWQLTYPPDSVLGGHPVRCYRGVLEWLIARAVQEAAVGEETSWRKEQTLIGSIAADLALAPDVVRDSVAAFTVDAENAAYHAAIPGVAAPPLVRNALGQIALSRHGLLSEPFIFLTRELRRLDPQGYHNAAYRREEVFRQDLYARFTDKRFVTSPGRIELRRAQGDVRTDIDAAIFDRKTGTLALFELKSQDPFARTVAELDRQRDNVLYANRQVSGILDWITRHGADEVLKRIDARTARTFRVQKVLPFVLGRYLAHFSGGAEPDRRAAWGAWPRVLRLLEEGTSGNPLSSLFTRLAKDERRVDFLDGVRAKEIEVGEMRLIVHPSYAAFRASAP